MLVEQLEIRNIVIINGKEDADAHENEVDITTNECKVVELSPHLPGRQSHLIRHVKIPVLKHVRHRVVFILLATVHIPAVPIH